MAAKNTSDGSAGNFGDQNNGTAKPHMQPVGMIGRINSFDNNIKSWELFFQRFEQYSSVNRISVDNQVACLLSVMGAKTYGLLRSLHNNNRKTQGQEPG